jgi:hypothetical protein
VTRRRRPEKRTIVETPPTMAELAAEAVGRVLGENPEPYRLGEGGKASAPFAPVLCGWCVRREGPAAKREHRRCDFDRCECFCRSERSADVTQPIATLLEDPRDGSGVRDAISQDPGLAGLLEGL